MGGGVGCRVLPIPESWFGFHAQTIQTFHLHGVGEWVSDLSIGCPPLVMEQAKYAFKLLPRHPTHVECVLQTKGDLLSPYFIVC